MNPGDHIPKPGPYQLHKGEQVIPAAPLGGMAAALTVLIQSKGIHAVEAELARRSRAKKPK